MAASFSIHSDIMHIWEVHRLLSPAQKTLEERYADVQQVEAWFVASAVNQSVLKLPEARTDNLCSFIRSEPHDNHQGLLRPTWSCRTGTGSSMEKPPCRRVECRPLALDLQKLSSVLAICCLQRCIKISPPQRALYMCRI